MRSPLIGVLSALVLMGTLLPCGCSDDSTGPGGGTEPQPEELTCAWSERFGDSEEQRGFDVAVDASGNSVVVGTFWGTVDFGGVPLTSLGATDIFVAKFGPDGAHLWSTSFGDATVQDNVYVTVDASGNVIITGGYYGVMDFGGGPLASAGSIDIFVAKFDPDGTHLWSDHFGSSGPQSGYGVAADPSGNVLLAGRFYGAVDFGGGPLTSGGNDDIYIAKFMADGTHVWSHRFGDASAQYATDVAVDGSGNVTITGYLEGSADFGGGTLTSAGSVDIFLAQFDPSGAHLWSKRFGDSEYEYPKDIACDPSGNIVIGGRFEASVDFGGGTLTSAGDSDAYVAAFTPSGAHRWSKRFGDALQQMATCVATDASGNVIIGGYFHGGIDFGGDAFSSAGYYDIFIARFSPSGAHLWSAAFGDDAEQTALGVKAGPSGEAIMTGFMEGDVDFGGGVLTSAGAEDVFVVKFEK